MKRTLIILGIISLLVVGAVYGPSWNTAPGQFSEPVALSMPGTAVEGPDGILSMASVSAGQNVFTLNRNGQDTVESITGLTNLKDGVYIFMVDTDDSSLVFPDAGQFKLAAGAALDKTDDKLVLYFDGTNFYTFGTFASAE